MRQPSAVRKWLTCTHALEDDYTIWRINCENGNFECRLAKCQNMLKPANDEQLTHAIRSDYMISLHLFYNPLVFVRRWHFMFRNFFLLAKFILLQRYDDKFYALHSSCIEHSIGTHHNYASSHFKQRDFPIFYLTIFRALQ